MTKEPIMIDDVDVNECEFHRYSGNHGELTHYCTYQKDEDGLDTYCNADFNKNCFYKKILRRLKRKEQKLKKIEEFRHNYCMNCEDLLKPSHSCKGCNMVELKHLIEGKQND